MKSTTANADILSFAHIDEDPFEAIDRMYKKAEAEKAERIAERRHQSRRQKVMRERKIASGILFVFMLIAMLALEFAYLMLVYNVWHPEFYNFLIIAGIGIMVLLCVMGLSYEYIKEKIYEDLIR